MYIGLTIINQGESFGSPNTEQRILVRTDLVDYIGETESGCSVNLGGGLGEVQVKESFEEIRGALCPQ